MPTNQEARSMAMRQRNAIVLPFVQLEGDCDGFVSWWLRSSLKNAWRLKNNKEKKSFWSEKYFGRIYNVANHIEEPEGRFVGGEYYDESGNNIERIDKGLEKARKLQAHFYGTNSARGYITQGIREDKPDRDPNPIAEFVAKEGPISISEGFGDDSEGIGKSFIKAAINRYVVKYGLTTTPAHAIGLDALESPRLRYFDPNIGEFIFPNVEELIKWWRHCYQNREIGGGAFGIMQYLFTAEYYELKTNMPRKQFF